MKKQLLFLAMMVTLILASCTSDKIQKTTGTVKSIKDSTMLVAIDKYDIRFDVSKARYDNGAVMKDDSVVIHYIGDLRDKEAKAVLVRLVPKQGTVVEAVYDPSKELITDQNPMPEEQVKKLEKFARSGKR